MSSCAAIVQPNAPTTLKRSGSMDAAHSSTLRCGQALSGTLCFSIGTTVFKRHDDVTPKVWTNPNTRGFRFEVDGGTENSDHKRACRRRCNKKGRAGKEYKVYSITLTFVYEESTYDQSSIRMPWKYMP